MFKKVALAISGGVDSAVAAVLLKRKGFEVSGIFMRNWDDGQCLADRDIQDAEWVCKKLNIPFYEVNFVKEYWNEVFSYLLKEYQAGCTPNPDIYCNRYIKFNHFFKFASRKLGADAMATGHYAKSSFGPYLENYSSEEGACLMQAKDPFKDQTFFLSQIPPEALRLTMFPLGDLMKSEVKRIAEEENMYRISKKKESTGICFIGKRNFSDFISEYVEDQPGKLVNLETNKFIGNHRGFHHYTLGQKYPEHSENLRMFVAKKDTSNNYLYLVPGTEHPFLYSIYFYLEEMVLINAAKNEEFLNNGPVQCEIRFQHGFPAVGATFYKIPPKQHYKENVSFVKTVIPLRAVTPGQFGVIYKDGECLGSARINSTGATLYEDIRTNYVVNY